MSSTAPTDSSVMPSTESPYRRTLKVVVSALAQDAGFAAADDTSLETLTEMLQSCEFDCLVNVYNPSAPGNQHFRELLPTANDVINIYI